MAETVLTEIYVYNKQKIISKLTLDLFILRNL